MFFRGLIVAKVVFTSTYFLQVLTQIRLFYSKVQAVPYLPYFEFRSNKLVCPFQSLLFEIFVSVDVLDHPKGASFRANLALSIISTLSHCILFAVIGEAENTEFSPKITGTFKIKTNSVLRASSPRSTLNECHKIS